MEFKLATTGEIFFPKSLGFPQGNGGQGIRKSNHDFPSLTGSYQIVSGIELDGALEKSCRSFGIYQALQKKQDAEIELNKFCSR